jgi:hypothetical protein
VEDRVRARRTAAAVVAVGVKFIKAQSHSVNYVKRHEER